MKQLIKQPIISEKTTVSGKEQGAYVFGVDISATKPEIKKAIEAKYKVGVVCVRTLHQASKTRHFRGRRSELGRLKKAIVVLKKGQSLPILPQ